MTDPRDTPGWTQTFARPDDSECRLLAKMKGDGYLLTEDDLGEIYARLGGAEHVEMLEDLERRGFCKEERRGEITAWVLTDWGREVVG